jgi:hypothetical protein
MACEKAPSRIVVGGTIANGDRKVRLPGNEGRFWSFLAGGVFYAAILIPLALAPEEFEQCGPVH